MEHEALQTQVNNLQRQVAELKARNQMMYAMLVAVSQRLQSSSASIKAAVSSLLDYDIFWDGSTQHEFLETIDDSVNQEAGLIMLMTLAFRAEADSLEIRREPHEFPEILSTVLGDLSTKTPEIQLNVDFPAEGTSVFVDYEYLAVALRLVLEVLVEAAVSQKITVVATEVQAHWRLDINGLPEPIAEIVYNLCKNRAPASMQTDHLSPENVLKLFTACQIFCLQDIQLDVYAQTTENVGLRLTVPTVE